MFKAKFKNAKFVRRLFEAISSIVTETRLKVTRKNELSMTALDGSHICLCDLHLKKEDLDEFESDQDYELGLNLDDLVKIIKRGSLNDEITLLHDPKEKRLKIEMKAENAKKARQFSMALIDIDVEEIDTAKLDELPFDNNFQFKIGILDEAIKDAEIFSEVLEIKVKQNLSFSAEGTMGDMCYELEPEEMIFHEIKADSKGSFAIQFLKSILKIGSITDQVGIKLATEQPLQMKFNLFNNSFVTYTLAPRVEEDSDSIYEED